MPFWIKLAGHRSSLVDFFFLYPHSYTGLQSQRTQFKQVCHVEALLTEPSGLLARHGNSAGGAIPCSQSEQ